MPAVDTNLPRIWDGTQYVDGPPTPGAPTTAGVSAQQLADAIAGLGNVAKLPAGLQDGNAIGWDAANQQTVAVDLSGLTDLLSGTLTAVKLADQVRSGQSTGFTDTELAFYADTAGAWQVTIPELLVKGDAVGDFECGWVLPAGFTSLTTITAPVDTAAATGVPPAKVTFYGIPFEAWSDTDTAQNPASRPGRSPRIGTTGVLQKFRVDSIITANGPGAVFFAWSQYIAGFTGTSEVQSLAVSATNGTFTLTGGSGGTGTTAPIAVSGLSAATLQTAVRTLPGFSAVTVTGTGPYTFTYPAALGDVGQLVVDATLATGGTVTMSTTTTGAVPSEGCRVYAQSRLIAAPRSSSTGILNGAQWVEQGNVYTVQTPQQPWNVKLAPDYVRLEIRPGDQWAVDKAQGKGVERVQLVGHRVALDTNIWTAFRFRLNGLISSPNDTLIYQMKQAPENGASAEFGKRPSVYIWFINGRLQIGTFGDPNAITTKDTYQAFGAILYDVPWLGVHPVDGTEWVDVLLRQKMHWVHGELDAWIKSTQVVSATGLTNAYNDSQVGALPTPCFDIYRGQQAVTTVLEFVNIEVSTADLSARAATPLPLPAIP